MTRQIRSNQQGVISIMMTVVIMMVISLIVLGLAQISRREVRQSTDAQLSAQAFYAAESGVNDVISIIKGSGAAASKTTCDPNPGGGAYADLDPDLSDGVSYTCVLVESGPTSVPINVGSEPVVQSLRTDGPVTSFKFTWNATSPDDAADPSTCPAAIPSAPITNLFPASNWTCPFPVLRIELPSTSTLTRDELQKTVHIFAVPLSSGGGSLTASELSHVAGASCNTNTCSLTVNVPSNADYYMRVSAIYGATKLIVSANGAKFKDLAVIDVTGKAQDILRRIRATVDLQASNQNGKAGAAIVSGDSVCKRFKVSGGGTADPDACGN